MIAANRFTLLLLMAYRGEEEEAGDNMRSGEKSPCNERSRNKEMQMHTVPFIIRRYKVVSWDANCEKRSRKGRRCFSRESRLLRLESRRRGWKTFFGCI